MIVIVSSMILRFQTILPSGTSTNDQYKYTSTWMAQNTPDNFKFSSNSFRPDGSSCTLSSEDTGTVQMVVSAIESGMAITRDWEELK